MIITIDTENRFQHRGKWYYPSKATDCGNGESRACFISHDLKYAFQRHEKMDARGLIPIPTEKTSMEELEEEARKGFLKALWGDVKNWKKIWRAEK